MMPFSCRLPEYSFSRAWKSAVCSGVSESGKFTSMRAKNSIFLLVTSLVVSFAEIAWLFPRELVDLVPVGVQAGAGAFGDKDLAVAVLDVVFDVGFLQQHGAEELGAVGDRRRRGAEV